MTPTEIISIITLVALLGGIIGGYLAYRTGLSKTKDVIAAQVINFLKTENEVLQQKVERVEKQYETQVVENKLLHQQFAFVIDVMSKSYGLIISFSDDILRIQDKTGQSTFSRNGNAP